MPTDCIVVAAVPYRIAQAAEEGALLWARFQITVIVRSINDATGARASARAGIIALAAMGNLIGWAPADDFGTYLADGIPGKRFVAQKVFVPFILKSLIDVRPTP